MRTVWRNALANKTNDLLTHQPGRVFRAMTREFEATLIRCALTAAGGCRLEAARLLGIGRNTIARKIDVLGLEGFATPSRRNRKTQHPLPQTTQHKN